jgi:asparagine synthase (glutamine-hydrolysing)
MAFGLEARVPFLDHRVAEFCLGLAFTEKVDGGLMKSVLRRAMSDVLPALVLERKDKLGYPTPVGRWLLDAATDVKEVLLYGFAERGLVPSAHVERAWLDHERGRASAEPWRLYRWLTTELWLRRFVDRPPSAPSPHA